MSGVTPHPYPPPGGPPAPSAMVPAQPQPWHDKVTDDPQDRKTRTKMLEMVKVEAASGQKKKQVRPNGGGIGCIDDNSDNCDNGDNVVIMAQCCAHKVPSVPETRHLPYDDDDLRTISVP